MNFAAEAGSIAATKSKAAYEDREGHTKDTGQQSRNQKEVLNVLTVSP